MVIIITGAIGIGKTTVCRKLIELTRNRGCSWGGFLTYKSANQDIIIENVQTGEKEILASTSNVYRGPRTPKYFFNPQGIELGIQAIDSRSSSDILLVDEIGHLELRGEGFINLLEPAKAGTFEDCVVVIRKELLSAFLPQLPPPLLVFEVTMENRHQLPQEISSMLLERLCQRQHTP